MSNRQSAGVGVFVRKFDKILVGRRGPLSRFGQGLLALPGGVLDHPESFPALARREVFEETGLAVTVGGAADAPYCVPGLLAVTDHFDQTQQQDGNLRDHLTFWIMSRWVSGEPAVMEPGKCEGWTWMHPCDVLATPGADNPGHPQYYWTPAPLWRKILRPYFGGL